MLVVREGDGRVVVGAVIHGDGRVCDRMHLHLDCGYTGYHMATISDNYNRHTQRPPYMQTQMSACEHGEISVSSVDCTDVSFLVLILHHNYAGVNHPG